MQGNTKLYYSDLITKIHNVISDYETNTININKKNIVLCLTRYQYYKLEDYLLLDCFKDVEPLVYHYDGIDIITSDLFYPNAPFIAEKGKPR